MEVNKHVIVKKPSNLCLLPGNKRNYGRFASQQKNNLYLLPQPGPSSRFTVRLFPPLPFQLTLILRNLNIRTEDNLPSVKDCRCSIIILMFHKHLCVLNII